MYLSIYGLSQLISETNFNSNVPSFRLIREYWNELNGRVIGEDGDLIEMNLLNLAAANGNILDFSNKDLQVANNLNKEALLSKQRLIFTLIPFKSSY